MSDISSNNVPAASESPESIVTAVTKLFDVILGKLHLFPDDGEKFSKIQRLLASGATWLSLVFGGVFFLLAIILGIKMRSWELSLFGALTMAVTGLVLHFILSRFAYAGHTLIRNTPYIIPSKNILEVLGFLSAGIAVLVAAGGTYAALKILGENMYVLGALASGIVLFIIGLLCVNSPACLNVRASADAKGNASDLAIGLLTCFARLTLQFAPVIAFLALVLLSVGGLGLMFMLIADKANIQTIFSLFLGIPLLAFPFIMYFIYIFFMLGIELLKSLLGIAKDVSAIANKR
jgi:hypothetical protein